MKLLSTGQQLHGARNVSPHQPASCSPPPLLFPKSRRASTAPKLLPTVQLCIISFYRLSQIYCFKVSLHVPSCPFFGGTANNHLIVTLSTLSYDFERSLYFLPSLSLFQLENLNLFSLPSQGSHVDFPEAVWSNGFH